MDRVLAVLPNWYGETLFAVPFLKALRRHLPQAHLATLGWPQCAEVLQHHPAVDALLTYDERGAHRSLGGKLAVLRTLRVERFTTAFVLRPSLSRTALLAAAGIRRRIGWAQPKSGWLLTDRVRPAPAGTHKAASYLPLLQVVGATAALEPYDYVVTEEERQQAAALLARHPSPPRGPLVILHPGANWPHKRWLPERFAAVGNLLSRRHQARLVLTGGPQDQPLVARVQQDLMVPTLPLVGHTTLRQLGACLALADLVIAADTGVLHLTAALRRPAIALFGPTSPALTGPLGDPALLRVIHHAQSCPAIPCYQPEHPGSPGMAAITVEEVAAAAATLLPA